MILGLETSSPRASLCLYDNGKVLWESHFETDRSHNSKLFTPLNEALDFCQRKLDLIAIGVGPGSYSGVRVGIAAANGISLALGVPVVGISSLLAFDAERKDYQVVGDARRKTFYIASITDGSLAGEPVLLDEAGLTASLNDGAIFTMDRTVADAFEQTELRFPTAEGIAYRASLQFSIGSDLPTAPVEPHYLRAPYITKAKKKPIPGFPRR